MRDAEAAQRGFLITGTIAISLRRWRCDREIPGSCSSALLPGDVSLLATKSASCVCPIDHQAGQSYKSTITVRRREGAMRRKFVSHG